jgi:hypothetical protein
MAQGDEYIASYLAQHKTKLQAWTWTTHVHHAQERRNGAMDAEDGQNVERIACLVAFRCCLHKGRASQPSRRGIIIVDRFGS